MNELMEKYAAAKFGSATRNQLWQDMIHAGKHKAAHAVLSKVLPHGAAHAASKKEPEEKKANAGAPAELPQDIPEVYGSFSPGSVQLGTKEHVGKGGFSIVPAMMAADRDDYETHSPLWQAVHKAMRTNNKYDPKAASKFLTTMVMSYHPDQKVRAAHGWSPFQEKKAFFEIFRSVDPKKKKLRDRIEDMIREEQLKRDQAKEQIAYGKQRLEEAGKPSGMLGWTSDIARSLIPGLSISASADDGIEKAAKSVARAAMDAARNWASTARSPLSSVFGGDKAKAIVNTFRGTKDKLRRIATERKYDWQHKLRSQLWDAKQLDRRLQKLKPELFAGKTPVADRIQFAMHKAPPRPSGVSQVLDRFAKRGADETPTETPTETPADKKWGGRLFDIAHLGAAGAGAGLGYARAKGMLHDPGTVRSVSKKLGKPLRDELVKVLGGGKGGAALKDWAANQGDMLALAASKPGLLSRTVGKISPVRLWRKYVSGKPTTPAEAMAFLTKKMRRSGMKTEAIRASTSAIRGSLGRRINDVLTNAAKGQKTIKLPGKWGAIGGAALLSAPFAISRLWKTRNLRASGGTAGQEAARKAEELLGGAEKLRKEREALMQQLG